jgi:hypothetical protein
VQRKVGWFHYHSAAQVLKASKELQQEEKSMVICIKIGGTTHCYEIVEVSWPFGPSRPGPGPVNYPQLFRDATIVASLQTATNHVADAGVRAALQGGLTAAVGALQKRGGAHVSVSSE